MEQEIKQIDRGWLEGAAKTITFIVTKDCQLACKYCYLVGKNENERMSIETAKAAVDYILDTRDFFNEKYYPTVWRFFRKPKARPFISKARCHTFAPAR